MSQLPQFYLRQNDGRSSTTPPSDRPSTSKSYTVPIRDNPTYTSHERPHPNASSYFTNIARNSSLNLSRSKLSLQHSGRNPAINLPENTNSGSTFARSASPHTSIRSRSRPPIVHHQSYAESLAVRRRSLSSQPHSSTRSLSDDYNFTARISNLKESLLVTAVPVDYQSQETVSRRSSVTREGYNTKMSEIGSAQIMYGSMKVGGTAPGYSVPGLASPSLETVSYQHIQEMCTKRISTLDYLRKAHQGRVYWFNTLLFTKADFAKPTFFESRKLARRATNFFLLGLSIPAVLDLISNNVLEYLRIFNTLLAEFEGFQNAHPADGTTSTMSRARIPQMFKRTLGTTGSRTSRRTSGAADIGLPYSASDLTGEGMSNANHPSSTFPSSENDLLPGEEYNFLLTPSLPFDPDFYETFATLCDVLIDCYTNIMKQVSGPSVCSAILAEAFTNADKKVRKIIVQGIVKEFEDASRNGAKSEIGGIGRVVLGGLT